ncbi:MAG: VWA domain-containing protein, partial [Deltaproteobacteria bacterium]|nr:VWA domain-containing protein [Deltaproteobacteria bacterium]
LLRRKPPDEQPFAATRLVPEARAIASRRTAIEDRALFALRALAVLALAVLGATPLFRCSSLSVARPTGASIAIAIVVDDSLSMRASVGEGKVTRLARAVDGARELVASLQQGDAVAVVLAGKPARVALASTTNVDAAKRTIGAIEPSDRATDLDGAIGIASELVGGLEHVDKRVVVLSDLDGEPGTRIAPRKGVALWAPMTEIKSALDDCGVVRADRSGTRVVVRVACSRGAADGGAPAPLGSGRPDTGVVPGGPGAARKGRRVAIRAGQETLADAPLHLEGGAGDVAFTLPDAALEKHATTQLFAVLDGKDAIVEDDTAPVVAQGAELRVAAVVDPSSDRLPTGGAPLVEQAFRAMDLGVQLAPMATVPDQREELDAVGLLLVDDAPGFTPSERRDLAAWVERGGVLLLALGPRSGAAPLGSGFTPMLPGLVRFRPSSVKGLTRRDDLVFADASDGLDDLAPKGRALLELESGATGLQTLARWADDAPFLVERRLGRGVAFSLTLPLASNVSDFGLRPALFALLERAVAEARARSGTGRTLVGVPWSIEEPANVEVRRLERDDRAVTLPVEVSAGRAEVVPPRAGLYEIVTGGVRATRVAALDERELAGGPVELPSEGADATLGGAHAERDVSPQIALFLLGLMACELAVRAYGRLRAERAAS